MVIFSFDIISYLYDNDFSIKIKTLSLANNFQWNETS